MDNFGKLKKCKTCGMEKPRSDFYSHAQTFDRLAQSCKKCDITRRIKWDREHKDRAKERIARWARRHPEYSTIQSRKYRARNPEIYKAKVAAYHQANKEKRNAQIAKHKKDFPWKNCAEVMKRHAQKLKATPQWANSFFIEEIYHLATLRTAVLGFKWHVDHIYPLQSKWVCGLHTEKNLRVIPASENQRKFNKPPENENGFFW